MGLKKSWVELTPPRLNSTQLFRIPKSPLWALARVLMVCLLHWVVRKFAIHEHLYFACRFRITQGWDVNLTPESVMLILCSNSPSFRRGLTRKWMIFWTVLKKTMSIRVGCKINTRAVAQHEFRFTSPSLNIRSTLDRHGKNKIKIQVRHILVTYPTSAQSQFEHFSWHCPFFVIYIVFMSLCS